MSETTDSEIYPDGPQPGAVSSEPPSSSEQPAPAPQAQPDPAAQPGAAEGELFVTNLLAEIANLTKRAIMAETMVAVLQAQAGKTK